MIVDKNKLVFREKTTDKNIFRDVFELNEYNISSFDEESVIVDIGAHIGSFSLKAFSLGAKKIFCFEANTENFIVCNYNCSSYNINVYNKAVRGNYDLIKVGSRPGNNLNVDNMNMGGLSVSYGDSIDVISLEDIIEQVGGKISLLKLDCEGSEYPIIFESKPEIFNHIDCIIGEFHPGTLLINYCDGFLNSPENLENYFKKLNYDTKFTNGTAKDYGHFVCRRS